MHNLEKELEYFKKNQNSLAEKYEGKILVIKGSKVIGVYDTELEAFLKTKEKEEPGTFIIQKCGRGKDYYTVTYHSRVSFD